MIDDCSTCYKDICICRVGCFSDNLVLNARATQKTNIINCDSKPCIISYHITKDSCGMVLCIYGCIITKITYTIDKECRKVTQVFLTSFNKCITIPDCNAKILSVSVNMNHAHCKRIKECNILAYFTLNFEILLKVPCEEEHNYCDKGFGDIECCNSITIDQKDTSCCPDKKDFTSEMFQLPENNYQSNIKNDYLSFMSKFRSCNRL